MTSLVDGKRVARAIVPAKIASRFFAVFLGCGFGRQNQLQHAATLRYARAGEADDVPEDNVQIGFATPSFSG